MSSNKTPDHRKCSGQTECTNYLRFSKRSLAIPVTTNGMALSHVPSSPAVQRCMRLHYTAAQALPTNVYSFILLQFKTSGLVMFTSTTSSRMQVAERRRLLPAPQVHLQSHRVLPMGWRYPHTVVMLEEKAATEGGAFLSGVLGQPSYLFISPIMNYSSNYLVDLPHNTNPIPGSGTRKRSFRSQSSDFINHPSPTVAILYLAVVFSLHTPSHKPHTRMYLFPHSV